MGEDGETPDRGMPLLSVPAAPGVDAMWVPISPRREERMTEEREGRKRASTTCQ